LYIKNDILTRKTRIEKVNKFKPSHTASFVTPKHLFDFGFRYDEEDYTWYDEHPEREKYFFRALFGIDSRICHLFFGGFDSKKDLGYCFLEEDFRKIAFEFNGTIFN